MASKSHVNYEANPEMVYCDLGHSLFVAEGRIKFFCAQRPGNTYFLAADQKKILKIKYSKTLKRMHNVFYNVIYF